MQNLDLEELRLDYKQKANKLNDIYLENFGHLWKYPLSQPGIMVFNDVLKDFRDVSAVVVGAGPSLTNHLEILKKNEKNLFIISVDAALPVLKKNGIEPNLIVCCDPGQNQSKNFEGLDVSSSFVFMASIVHPLTFDEARRAKARILWYNLADVESHACRCIARIVGKKGALIPGVLTSAIGLQAAIWMGLRRIAFLGHDLSYPGNKGYVEGISEEKKQRQEKLKFDDLIEFKDLKGETVLTHQTFIIFKEWINEMITTQWSGVNFHNCSEQGIFFGDLIEQNQFKDFINNYSEKGKGIEVEKVLELTWVRYRESMDYVISPVN